MSANDDEFGADLESLLADTPLSAPKKAPAKKAVTTAKTPADPATDRVVEEPTVTNGPPADQVDFRFQPPQQPAITLDVLKSLLDDMKSSLRAEMTEQIAAAQPVAKDKHLDAVVMMEAAQAPVPHVDPAEGRLIHFVEDGLTIGGRVFYRGEEFVAPQDAAWAQMSGREQVLKFGHRVYREGPWDGDGFDLADPALTPSDRARLLELTKTQQRATQQYR